MRENGFILIERDMIRSVAWQSLSPKAGWVLIDMWSRHNGKNNGAIPYGLGDAQKLLGCGRSTAVGLLHELEDKGFIVAVRRGSFNVKSGKARRTVWRLTMEPYEVKGRKHQPTHEYLSWIPKEEKSHAGNSI